MILVRREDEGEDKQEDEGDDEGGPAHNRLGPRFVDQSLVRSCSEPCRPFLYLFFGKNLPSASRDDSWLQY